MVYYLGILLVPLIIVLGGMWLFLASRRSKIDETGRNTYQSASKPRTESRAHGRET